MGIARRGTIKKIADGDPWTMPATIDDPAILGEIEGALKGHRGGELGRCSQSCSHSSASPARIWQA